MMAGAGALDPADETSREYETVVDAEYLDQIRTEVKQFSNKLLSRQSGVARYAVTSFKNEKKHHQAECSTKADKGQASAKQKDQELKMLKLTCRETSVGRGEGRG